MKLSTPPVIQLLLVCILYGLALGKENCDRSIFNGLPGTTIPDEAFSASTFVFSEDDDIDFGPTHARIGIDQQIQNHRVWRAGVLDTSQYIQVNLGAPFLVRGIQTQGCGLTIHPGDCDEYVSSYMLQYSMDGENWQNVREDKQSDTVFNGNSDSTGFVTNFLDCPFIARYVRINPQNWHTHISMAFDLFGCEAVKDTNFKRMDLGLVLTEPVGGDNANMRTFQGQLHKVPVGDGIGHGDRKTKHSRSLTISTNKRPLTGTECLGGLGGLSCLGKRDGEYQHCVSCTKFIRCNDTHLAEFVCPSDLVWDDNVKDCMQSSTTCK